MTSKYVVCGICIIASLMLQVISADITTNEVNDGAEYSLGGVRVYPNDLPVRPAPCAEHLGECMDRCHPRVQKPGTDCKNGQVCCLLL